MFLVVTKSCGRHEGWIAGVDCVEATWAVVKFVATKEKGVLGMR